jgi:hypothetical protein
MIRKSLEEMNNEAREMAKSKKLAANLEKDYAGNERVATNLQTQKIDDALIKQQEKILFANARRTTFNERTRL